MIKLILGLSLLVTMPSFASIPSTTHLGCQLYTGEPSVFYDLRKFNISRADSEGRRVLDAYLAENRGEGLKGECYDITDGIMCKYISTEGKEISVILDNLFRNEIEGTVFYDGWINRSHEVSCDLFTF